MSQSATKSANVKKALSDPRTRAVFLGGIILCVVMVVVLGFILSRKNSSSEVTGGSSVGAPPPMVDRDYSKAGATTAEYDALLEQSNQAQASEALATGDSSIPVPRGQVESSIADPVDATTPAPNAQAQPVAVPIPAPSPANDPNYQAALAEREDAIKARSDDMKKQLARIQGYWAYQTHASISMAKETDRPAPATADATTPVGAARSGTSAGAIDIRVGDMLYATLDTAINTDEPSPVVATIRQPGPFQGAKLIGEISAGQDAKAVGVKFTSMSVPGELSARGIDAWAVDPNKDYRAALATDVNNHYVSRGLSVFIGSFLAGYADGLLRGGQQENVITTGETVVVQKDAYSDRQLVEIGVGNVGRTASQQLSQGVNRKRTIKVAAGIDIGILFLQDAAPQH